MARTIRVFGWTQALAEDAKRILTLQERALPPEEVWVVKSLTYWSPPEIAMNSKASTDCWPSFQQWSDSLIKKLAKSVGPMRQGNGDRIVFLLDAVPRKWMPLISCVWADGISELLKNAQDSLVETPIPWRLAVLSSESQNKFAEGCADPPALFEQLKQIRSFKLDLPLLLTGDTGSGKSYFAQLLHYMTMPAEAPFRQVNLAEFSEETNSLKSFLEGHAKGAFTGAIRKEDGLLRRYRNGTIFFDELDGLSLRQQIRLLTLMERNRKVEVTRLGETEPEVIDRCNMVFATNRPVEHAIQMGTLRPDFAYRCREQVDFQPLHELFGPRAAGIGLRLARATIYLLYFLQKQVPSLSELANADTQGMGPNSFWDLQLADGLVNPESEAQKRIREFAWPGNFRTFEKYCRHLLDKRKDEKASVGFSDETEWAEDWKEWTSRQYRGTQACPSQKEMLDDGPSKVNFPRTLSEKLHPEFRRRYREMIQKAMDLSKDGKNPTDRLNRAAKILGNCPRTLKKKMAELDLHI